MWKEIYFEIQAIKEMIGFIIVVGLIIYCAIYLLKDDPE